MKALAGVAALLVLAVMLASASLRLAAALLPGAAAAPWQDVVRLTHRVSASAAGLLFVLAVAFGWRRWNGGERLAGVLLLAVTLGLALIGRATPQDAPAPAAVALGNVLGGYVLLAALAWLLAPPSAPSAPSARSAPSAPTPAGARPTLAGWLLLGSAVDIVLGALLGTRLAGAEPAVATAVHAALGAALLGAALWAATRRGAAGAWAVAAGGLLLATASGAVAWLGVERTLEVALLHALAAAAALAAGVAALRARG